MNIAGGGIIGTFSIVMEENVSGRLESNLLDFTVELDKVLAVNAALESFPIKSLNLTVPLTTSTREFLSGQAISIFPNPTKDFLVIQAEQLKLESIILFNTIGQSVLQKDLGGSSSSKLLLPDLTNGFYWLQIHTNKGTLTKKLCINTP